MGTSGSQAGKLMHQAHVIEETDGPQWVSVLHHDGTLSEFRITPEPDGVSLHVEMGEGKRLNNFEIEASNATT